MKNLQVKISKSDLKIFNVLGDFVNLIAHNGYVYLTAEDAFETNILISKIINGDELPPIRIPSSLLDLLADNISDISVNDSEIVIKVLGETMRAKPKFTYTMVRQPCIFDLGYWLNIGFANKGQSYRVKSSDISNVTKVANSAKSNIISNGTYAGFIYNNSYVYSSVEGLPNFCMDSKKLYSITRKLEEFYIYSNYLIAEMSPNVLSIMKLARNQELLIPKDFEILKPENVYHVDLSLMRSVDKLIDIKSESSLCINLSNGYGIVEERTSSLRFEIPTKQLNNTVTDLDIDTALSLSDFGAVDLVEDNILYIPFWVLDTILDSRKFIVYTYNRFIRVKTKNYSVVFGKQMRA